MNEKRAKQAKYCTWQQHERARARAGPVKREKAKGIMGVFFLTFFLFLLVYTPLKADGWAQ